MNQNVYIYIESVTQDKINLYIEHAVTPIERLVIPANAGTHPFRLITINDKTNLHELIRDKEVIVFVPAEDVLCTHVTLPKMKWSQAKQAIPFTLEERLAAD